MKYIRDERYFVKIGLPFDSRPRFRLPKELLAQVEQLAAAQQIPAERMVAQLVAEALAQRARSERLLTAWGSLTRREQQVVAMFGLGNETAEVARRLVVSENTVRSHLYSAQLKFGEPSKAALLNHLTDWDFSAWLE